MTKYNYIQVNRVSNTHVFEIEYGCFLYTAAPLWIN